MNDVTRILEAIGQGDPHAAGQLLPLAYDETDGDCRFADRQHFLRVAAEAMRRVLIDHARRKRRRRRGGDGTRVPRAEAEPAAETPPEGLLALDEALERFAAVDPAKAELVKLRYFAGLSEEDAAAALGISRATASRWWAYARAWLI